MQSCEVQSFMRTAKVYTMPAISGSMTCNPIAPAIFPASPAALIPMHLVLDLRARFLLHLASGRAINHERSCPVARIRPLMHVQPLQRMCIAAIRALASDAFHGASHILSWSLYRHHRCLLQRWYSWLPGTSWFLHLNRRRGRASCAGCRAPSPTMAEIGTRDLDQPVAPPRAAQPRRSVPSLILFSMSDLAPRQMPLRWALWGCRRRQETLTFQANLACPPSESLEIGRIRWSVRTGDGFRNPDTCPRYTVATLYISTQPTWRAAARRTHQRRGGNPRFRVSRGLLPSQAAAFFGDLLAARRPCGIPAESWPSSTACANSPQGSPTSTNVAARRAVDDADSKADARRHRLLLDPS